MNPVHNSICSSLPIHDRRTRLVTRCVKILETERLILRSWDLEDAEDAFSIWGDPDVMQYIGDGSPIQDLEGIRRSIKEAQRVQDKHGHCLWAVIQRQTDALIGACGFHRLDDGLELAFHFAKQHWGQGYATEASQACIDYAFTNLGTNKVFAWYHPQNTRSKRVLQKLNFISLGEDEGEIKNRLTLK